MINFCTLFDSNYLTRGLVLYESLKRCCPSFQLFVVAFDDKCYGILSQIRLPNLVLISLKEFEDEKLLEVKPTRSAAEYCWTCTPAIISYCISSFNLDACTYIDADMEFYMNPQIIIDEAKGDSVIITGHRYTKEYDQSDSNGIYCVQFMYFRNDKRGQDALEWWRERCLEWCFDRHEDGKFGDQKYLDDWPVRFKGVHVSEHEGCGVAPWNIQRYFAARQEDTLTIKRKDNGQEFPVIFFHFHGLKFFTDGVVSLSGSLYELDPEVKNAVYYPYVERLLQMEKNLKTVIQTGNINGARKRSPAKKTILKNYIIERLFQFKGGRISLFQLLNLNFKKHFHYQKILNDGDIS